MRREFAIVEIMQQDKVRWGILSTANIARKNWLAIRNSGNGVVVAVASRGLGRAQQFIDECQADAPMPGSVRALGSYDELLAMPEVEAVYIPLPTGLRKEWVIRAAQAGKHVLCEKPCAISSLDLREMTEACARHGVQFMDGVMFMHSQRLARLHEVIASGAIGTVRRVATAFSFLADADFYASNIRGSREMEPFGCLGDLGWYCLRLTQCMTDFAEPRDVSGTIHAEKGPPGVPTEFSGELFYDSGVSAVFYCSFSTADEEWAVITGTKGVIRISDFVLPFYGADIFFCVYNAQLDIVGCRFNMESSRRTVVVAEYSHAHANAQETNMVREFARLARGGKPDVFWPEAALKTQALMERCLDAARRGKGT